MEEKSQCFRLAEAEVSERANEGRVPATWRFQFGVVVPMPILPLVVKLPFDEVVALPPTATVPLYKAVKIGAELVALLMEKIERFCCPEVVAFSVKEPLTPRPPWSIELPRTSSVPLLD